MSHGCYAIVHSLPDEPVDFAAGLRERWRADKKPQTPEEEHLVNEMYRGDLMAMRYHRAMDRALIRQQEMNLHRWEEARQETVAELKQRLVTGPAEMIENVLDELRGFGHGVRALIADFEDLSAALQNPGFWNTDRCRTAVFFLSAQPGLAAVAEREEVYRLVLFNFLATPERLRPPGEIERMAVPANRPVELRGIPCAALLVPAEEARAALQQWVDESLVELRESLPWIEANVDARERAAVTDPAAIVIDPDKLKRFRQIGIEYRSIYYRASSVLRTVRKDKEEGPEKKPPKKTDPTGARGSTANDTRADRAAAAEPPASPGAPKAAEMDITTSVGESADGAGNERCRQTENDLQQRVAERDPGVEAETGNEPSSSPAEAPGGIEAGAQSAAPPVIETSRAGPAQGEAPSDRSAALAPGSDGASPSRAMSPSAVTRPRGDDSAGWGAGPRPQPLPQGEEVRRTGEGLGHPLPGGEGLGAPTRPAATDRDGARSARALARLARTRSQVERAPPPDLPTEES
jgi:hypothetical protein